VNSVKKNSFLFFSYQILPRWLFIWRFLFCSLAGMIPALALFEGGLIRRKNLLSVFMQIFAGLAVLSIMWFSFGYSLSFGKDSFFGLIGGFDNAFLLNVSINGMLNEQIYKFIVCEKHVFLTPFVHIYFDVFFTSKPECDSALSDNIPHAVRLLFYYLEFFNERETTRTTLTIMLFFFNNCSLYRHLHFSK